MTNSTGLEISPNYTSLWEARVREWEKSGKSAYATAPATFRQKLGQKSPVLQKTICHLLGNRRIGPGQAIESPLQEPIDQVRVHKASGRDGS